MTSVTSKPDRDRLRQRTADKRRSEKPVSKHQHESRRTFAAGAHSGINALERRLLDLLPTEHRGDLERIVEQVKAEFPKRPVLRDKRRDNA